MTPNTASPDAPIVFIGGGNMARSLIGGLVARGGDASTVRVVDPNADSRDALARDFGVRVHADAADAVDGAATWVLATKPQVLRGVCESLAAMAQAAQPLVLSIAAGITATQLERWLGGDVPVVRTMPNTPALLGAGVTGLYANARVDDAARARAQALLESAGATVWLDDEARMDAVTAVSGSGPAYIFLLAEAMEEAAIAQGLPSKDARTLVLQTVLGAARMLVESDAAPAELRRRVTSPGGTTQAAIETFEAGGLRTLVAEAIANAARRGGELSAAND
ncbi:pyrroline-5-carboxylate reductase [Luteimonas sp. XNQY3]|nr:pyrroline-5-carboxylate reductase [Luteimonas sp. XNQY3]MCD9005998.1 pyrroline-5-carboxylate reductase [Luteimonas sp. XNQY3]